MRKQTKQHESLEDEILQDETMQEEIEQEEIEQEEEVQEESLRDEIKLKSLLEAIILAAGRPMTEEDILKVFTENERPSKKELKAAMKALQEQSEDRGVHLVELASGYQFQIKTEWAQYIGRLWEEKAPRYSRALFETLALIAYRQPITRGEIEEIRGVSLSPSIFKTLQEEREWIRIVGHREVPGRPALYATTKNFLDYFGINSLEALPSLPEIMNLDAVQLPEEIVSEMEENSTESEAQVSLAEEIVTSETEELVTSESDEDELVTFESEEELAASENELSYEEESTISEDELSPEVR